MPTITLTLPVAGTGANAGPIATNFADLQALLNGGLDDDNVDSLAPSKLSQMAATTGQVLVWDGTQWEPGSAGVTQLYDSLLTTTAASFDVSSISQNYNHLKILLQLRCDNAITAQNLLMRLNNDSGANYDSEYGSFQDTTVAAIPSAAATSAIMGRTLGSSAPASHPSVHEIVIPNYKATTFFKAGHQQSYYRYGAAANQQESDVGSFGWRSTSAINRVTIFPNAGNFIAGSRITIYGLL